MSCGAPRRSLNFPKATGDGRQSVTAAIFWLKTRAGWKETSRHEVDSRTDVSFVTIYEGSQEYDL